MLLGADIPTGAPPAPPEGAAGARGASDAAQMEGAPGAQVPGWGEGTGREEGPTAFCSLCTPGSQRCGTSVSGV